MTLAVAGGGTAGHVVPGLAVLEEWRRLLPKAELFFIGAEGGFEQALTQEAAVELVELPSTPFARQGLAGKARAGVNLLRATIAARVLLRERDAAFVLGLGGYASAPALAAARWCGIPSALHEANVQPGLGNRLSAHSVDRIYLGWAETAARFPRSACQVVGNPLPSSRLPADSDLDRPRREGPPRILVMGGSEGSPQINAEAPRLLDEAQRRGYRFEVRHLSGLGDRTAVERAYAAAGIEAAVDSFVPNLAELYRESEAAISTAGAFTLAELEAWGLPALLAPLVTAANRHQDVNAQAFAQRTGAVLEWSADGVAILLERYSESSGASRTAPARDAAEPARVLAQACLELLA